MTVRVVSLPALLHDRHASEPGRDAIAILGRELGQTSGGGEGARLHHLLGRLEERRGRIPEATQHYLEATNLAPGDLPPLEALIGLAAQRSSTQNLSGLLERLADVAEPGSRRQEAFLLLSELQRRQGRADEVRRTIERWLEGFPEDPAAWLALDVLAGQTRDMALRERARLGRAATAQDRRWRALLLLDCAALRASSADPTTAEPTTADPTTALDLCRQAFDEHASLMVLVEWERRAVEFERWTEASQIAERAAVLLRESSTDPDAAARAEVPSSQLGEEQSSLWLLRAAEWARRDGQLERSASLFDRCAEERPGELLPRLAQVLSRRDGPEEPRRARHLEAEIEKIGAGPVAAALWLDLAGAAARAGDLDGQGRAIAAALPCDPASLRVRALHLDMVERTGSAVECAAALAQAAEKLGPAQVDWLATAALIAAQPDPRGPAGRQRQVRVGALLEAARRAEPFSALLATVQGMVAHFLGDPASFEASLEFLAQSGSPEARLDAALGLVRLRLLTHLGDGSAAQERGTFAPEELLPSNHEGHLLLAWLRAGVLPLWGASRHHADSVALEEALPSSAARIRHGARLITIRRLLEEGDVRGARERLAVLSKEGPGELLASALLADALAADAPEEAATVLAAAARREATPFEVRAAWLLRAGRLLWQGDRADAALMLIREAAELAPRAAEPWLRWGARRLAPDDPGARAHQLERSVADRGHYAVLERLTLAIRRGELTREPGSTSPAPLEAAPPAAGTAVDGAEELQARATLWLTTLMRAAYSAAGTAEPWRALTALPPAPAGLGSALRYAASFGEHSAPPAELVATAARWASEAPRSVEGALAWLVECRAAGAVEAGLAARAELGRRLNAPEFGAGAALLARLLGSPDAAALVPAASYSEDEAPEALPERLLRWAHLELAPPGGDDAQRAAALEQVAQGKRLLTPDMGGSPSEVGSLLAMAGFARLRAGDARGAILAFREVTELLPDDLGAWEGLRTSARALDDRGLEAEACTELARRTYDARRAAAFWERAGVLYQENPGGASQAEEAFAAALARDFSRDTAFERLYLIVRAKGDQERLLDLLEGRLGAVDEPRRSGELLWEKARLLRRLDRTGPALRALDQLLAMQPDHLGALALSGELCLRARLHDRAVSTLTRLADLEGAPEAQRLLAGLAAANLLERKLGDPRRALSTLRALQDAGLASAHPDGETLVERLGFCALHAGEFEEAAAAFEIVLAEAATPSARAEAAAFLLALYRDQLAPSAPQRLTRATQAAHALLAEEPTNPDALAFLIDEVDAVDAVDAAERRPILERALDELRREAEDGPLASGRLELVAQLAEETGAQRTALAAHGGLHLLGRLGPEQVEALMAFTGRFPRAPRDAAQRLAPRDLDEIAGREEHGPFREVAALLPAECLRVLEPGLDELRVRPASAEEALDELDPALGEWARVFGFEQVAVRRSTLADRIFALAGPGPTLVLGDELRGPFDDRRRARAVGALYTLARGTAVFAQRDEALAAQMMASVALAVGASELARALEPDEERARALGDDLLPHLSPELRARLLEVLSAAPKERDAFGSWYRGARLSAIRAGALLLGEPSQLRRPLEEMVDGNGSASTGSPHADPSFAKLIAFTLSTTFADLREALGLEDV